MKTKPCPHCAGTGAVSLTREEIAEWIDGFGRRLLESTERSERRRGRDLPEERALVGKIVAALRAERLGAAA